VLQIRLGIIPMPAARGDAVMCFFSITTLQKNEGYEKKVLKRRF
jgi:hypothetical protein